MSRRSDSRERVLAVERILSERPQTVREIMQRLDREYGIRCDRKAVYQDIAVLHKYMPIIFTSGEGFFLRGVPK